MKKTITVLLVLLLAVSMFSFAALADGENEPDLAAAPDLAVTAPAPDIAGDGADMPAVKEEPTQLAPVPDGAELVPNDAVDSAAPADEGGCNPTVWIIVACVAVVAIVVIVVLAKKKKK